MKNAIPVWAVIIVGVLALAGLMYFAIVSPLLYSPVKDQAETRFQLNTDALTPAPVNSTTDIYPLMQDLLDEPGSITLNIRLRDMTSAQADLAAYLKTYKNLNNVVLNLDMTESEIDNFTKSADFQDELFGQLLNETGSLDSLKNLEIRYRDSDDPGMMVSVQYQGAALQKRLGELYDKYKKEHATNSEIGEKYGLSTAQYNQSLDEFQKIVAQAQEVFGTEIIIPQTTGTGPSLTLALDPDTAVYRDTIRLIGHLYPVTENTTSVSILLDNSLLKNLTADENGEFTGSFVVEKIPAGMHTLAATAGDVTSPDANVEILPVDSVTMLEAYPDPEHVAVICNGSVMGNRPVRFAPVKILDNNRTIYNATTDARGLFNVTVPVSWGRHVLVARFDSPEYPVNASESDPVEVPLTKPVVPSSGAKTGWDPLPAILAAACVLVLSAAGGILYFRKKTATGPAEIPQGPLLETKPVAGDTPGLPADTTGNPGEMPAPLSDDAVDLRLLFETTESREGISPAAFTVYRTLAGRAAMLHHIDRFATRTPREMAALCSTTGFGPAFSRFIVAYENIRYAGMADPETRSLFLDALTLASGLIMGDRS
ncbi:MAG: hypothetical protein WC342_08550 [Methanoregula sp.]|jgi:hypothetical protein